MMGECHRLLERTSREVGAHVDRLTTRATSSDGRVAQLDTELEVARDDLQKMKEIMASNEMQRLGLEKRMSDLQDHIFSVGDQLRKSFTSLHQLALACGVELSIPAHPDETSLTSALGELATKMEVIPSKHAARVSEEISKGSTRGLVMSSLVQSSLSPTFTSKRSCLRERAMPRATT